MEKQYFFASRLFQHKIASACDFYSNLVLFWLQKPTKIASWRRLGASWRPLRASWARLGAFWAHLGTSWSVSETSWSVLKRLEVSWARFEFNLCVQGGSPGEIGYLRTANSAPSRGQQGGEGEGSPPLGGCWLEAQGVAGEAQRHRATRLHALRPEASADYLINSLTN